MSAKSRLPRDAWHALSPHRAQTQVRPVRGPTPGTPRARTRRRRARPPGGRRDFADTTWAAPAWAPHPVALEEPCSAASTQTSRPSTSPSTTPYWPGPPSSASCPH
ncbi:hypothetical protein F3K20_19210 [Streptomyces scabiei]|nr:hypothetical protein [Streptomyces sp. LBUM 1484]MBP5868039.1 hypothetical protein [Streptomyces sp. LBUM 1485]MBP5876496.1 hypothetical protein [Streptomyces sp. LBUM 1477]MBP5884253.1 hypothetical protein [Streptomyces sp. LBUM 1487]MBP5892932.1 hypothetical protein [Streptomyces sp. LBUM 1481]MBP5900267.1 hypothetical protein [Streptomyces sp. LBUM 1488]MBP5916148.1 hypothetical protein [Streptomyces sp. LBUM 1486]MBP5923193.1 hypothetical protein [Streptomyces sp. LBUM 1483]MBP593077